MAGFNHYLLDKNSNTPTLIYFNVFWKLNGKNVRFKFYETLNKVHPKKWDSKKQKVKEGFPNYVEINSRISEQIDIAEKILQRFEEKNKRLPSLKEFRELFLNEVENTQLETLDFFNFFKSFIEQSKTKISEQTGRPISNGTIKIYNNCYNHLTNFARTKKKKIDFDTINLDFYNDFKDYLNHDKQFTTNTIGRIIKVIKTVLNDATERGVNKNLSFKSKRFKVISEQTDSIYLTDDELTDLYNLDLTNNKKLERVRDLFLIGCYTGLRFSDFSKLTLKNIEGSYIKIETQKTGENVIIPLHPKIIEILKRYNNDLPPSISNQKMNEYLKELADNEKELKSLQSKVTTRNTKGGSLVHTTVKKYKLISTHTARRSFATNAYLKGVPPFVIMGVTGHKTEKAFFQYIKITPNDKAKILEMYMKNNIYLKVI